MPDLCHCVKPECERMVDRTRKRTGACCNAHKSYCCRHPTCLVIAHVLEYEFYTHAYATKIGQVHLPWRVTSLVLEQLGCASAFSASVEPVSAG